MLSSQECGDTSISLSTVLTPEDNSGLNEAVAALSDNSLRLEAHPGEKLLAHCLQVGLYARRLIREIPLRLPAGLSREAFEKLVFLAGACHDFGKATNRFQCYLKANDSEKEKLKNDRLKQHALLGAVVAYVMLKYSDLDKELQATPTGCILRLAPFWVIRRHHGNLLYPLRDLSLGANDTELLAQQLDDCPSAEFDFILQRIAKNGDITLLTPVTRARLKEEIEKLRLEIGCDGQDIANAVARLKKDETGSLTPWLLIQQLYSVLLAADKSYAAVEIRKPINDCGLNPAWVNQYRAGKFKADDYEGVNVWRAEVTRLAAETVKAAPVNTPFFNLTLPTGLGKTLIALDCALLLRERLQSDASPKRTIIYALPYLSILEQAAGVYDEVFATALGCNERDLPSEIMIRHHHLAELRYVKGETAGSDGKADANREFNPNQSQLMVEGWRSALVMTSTVQLFQSLFAGRNRTTRKLHRLAGAIVILDEIQSIPFKYWPLLNRAMRAINQLFDTRFILVTATQPRFLECDDANTKAVELVPTYKSYFDRLDRTITRVDLTLRSIESFAEVVKSKLLEEHVQQDALIIVNTIKSAIKLFHILSLTLGSTHDVIHLSTNIVPDERAKRIALIKNRHGQRRPVVVVSTQLVEAGVDLSFPILFRDFAPFSSIVQAAGRANRNGEYPSRGQVYVFRLINERGKAFAEQIYDQIELNATEEVLRKMLITGSTEMNEEQLLAGIENYFTELNIRTSSTQESHEVLSGARNLCFKPKPGERESLESFRLIEEEDTQEVFIEVDERAAQVWREYEELYRKPFNRAGSLEESFDRAGKLRAALIKCRPFILSIPTKCFHDDERAAKRKDEICYYSQSEIARVYDHTVGWIRTE
jgi:CRISPR-associated endonuclease/helicase Cas3